MRGPCANHVAGANPSARLWIEQLTAGRGDAVDIGTTGNQYPTVLQKGRGMGDMALAQVWRRNPRPKVRCFGLSGYSARSSKRRHHPDLEDAPKPRLHGSLDTAG